MDLAGASEYLCRMKGSKFVKASRLAPSVGLTWHAGNGCYSLEQRKYEQVNANIIFPITT